MHVDSSFSWSSIDHGGFKAINSFFQRQARIEIMPFTAETYFKHSSSSASARSVAKPIIDVIPSSGPEHKYFI